MKNLMDTTECVKKQYQSDKGLDTRISLHTKYSVNKKGYGNWIMEQYEITKGMRILELGCGNGSMWKNHTDLFERCGQVYLTDFSEGMLETARENLGTFENVTYQAVDIQDIPFEEDEFDLVIANSMLYHVPDLHKGLSEVRRVLKPTGKFYCATGGKRGPLSYAAERLLPYGVDCNVHLSFDLDNGAEILSGYFGQIEKRIYEDALQITNIDDYIEYLFSGITFPKICPCGREELKAILERNMVNGVLDVPKDVGVFMCQS